MKILKKKAIQKKEILLKMIQITIPGTAPQLPEVKKAVTEPVVKEKAMMPEYLQKRKAQRKAMWHLRAPLHLFSLPKSFAEY